MKKLLPLVLLPVLAAAAFLVWQNLPEKRHARHMIKARLFVQENNLTAARLEYEKAYAITDGYTPYVSLEVLSLTNRLNLQDNNAAAALENTRMFVAGHPANKEGRMQLSQLAFQAGELETAFESIDALLALDPWHFSARLLLAGVRSRQGRLDLAEEQMRLLYARYPDSLGALLPLAEVLLKQGRTMESRGFLARVIRDHPRNTAARTLMVDSYLRERNLDSAQGAIDSWQGDDPDLARQLQIRKARLYSLSDRIPEAKAALAAFTERTAANLPAFAELAILHVKSGQYDSAIADYRTMAKISPAAQAAVQNLVVYLHLKNQNPAQALEALKSMQVSDRRPALLPPLIATYLAIGQENKADELIGKQKDTVQKALTEFKAQLLPDKEFIGQWALITYYGINQQEQWTFQATGDLYRRWPRSALAANLYLSQLTKQGKFAEAAQVMAALENPTPSRQAALVGMLAKAGRQKEAVALANRLLAEHPEQPGVNMFLADHWLKTDKASAVLHYERELALDPDNLVALNNLAWEYGIEQSNLEKAAPLLEKLKAKKRLDPRILDTIGWILAVNGKGNDGKTFIRNALNLVPDYPTFQYHLAFVLAKEGRKEEARKYLKAAVSSSQPFEDRKAAEQLLAQQG